MRMAGPVCCPVRLLAWGVRLVFSPALWPHELPLWTLVFSISNWVWTDDNRQLELSAPKTHVSLTHQRTYCPLTLVVSENRHRQSHCTDRKTRSWEAMPLLRRPPPLENPGAPRVLTSAPGQGRGKKGFQEFCLSESNTRQTHIALGSNSWLWPAKSAASPWVPRGSNSYRPLHAADRVQGSSDGQAENTA